MAANLTSAPASAGSTRTTAAAAPCGVIVNVEQRFVRTPDGTVWTDGAFPYAFWSRYLAVFDRVTVIARVREGPLPSGSI